MIDFRKTKLNKKTIPFLVLGLIVLLTLLVFFKAFALFIILVVGAAILNYFIHLTEIHFHIGLAPFFGIIFSYSLGFNFGLAAIFLIHVIPEIITARVELEIIPNVIVYSLICYLASLFNSANILFLGIGLTVIMSLLSFGTSRLLAEPINEMVTEEGLEFVMCLIYFISFSEFFVNIIK